MAQGARASCGTRLPVSTGSEKGRTGRVREEHLRVDTEIAGEAPGTGDIVGEAGSFDLAGIEPGEEGSLDSLKLYLRAIGRVRLLTADGSDIVTMNPLPLELPLPAPPKPRAA